MKISWRENYHAYSKQLQQYIIPDSGVYQNFLTWDILIWKLMYSQHLCTIIGSVAIVLSMIVACLQQFYISYIMEQFKVINKKMMFTAMQAQHQSLAIIMTQCNTYITYIAIFKILTFQVCIIASYQLTSSIMVNLCSMAKQGLL